MVKDQEKEMKQGDFDKLSNDDHKQSGDDIQTGGEAKIEHKYSPSTPDGPISPGTPPPGANGRPQFYVVRPLPLIGPQPSTGAVGAAIFSTWSDCRGFLHRDIPREYRQFTHFGAAVEYAFGPIIGDRCGYMSLVDPVTADCELRAEGGIMRLCDLTQPHSKRIRLSSTPVSTFRYFVNL